MSPILTGNRQRGVSLVFALITLVALGMASVAMIRSVDTGTLILGNMGFKQDTQLAAEDAARTAMTWLVNNSASTALHSNSVANGYYASVNNQLNPTGNGTGTLLIDWDGSGSCTVSATRWCPAPELSLLNGVKARYLIVRLCTGAGDPNGAAATIHCAKPLTASVVDTGGRGSLDYVTSTHGSTGSRTQYYRILVRARGPRNTTTFTETVIHF